VEDVSLHRKGQGVVGAIDAEAFRKWCRALVSGHNHRVPTHAGQLKRGIVFAGLAAVLFGVTAPLLKRASDGVGTFFAGSLVYLGAALAAGLMAALRSSRESAPSVPRGSRARIAVVALLGAVVAPALLVAGLRRTDGATASLLLALEAPFTLVLARLLLGERIGARVAAAALLISMGGAALVGAALVGGAGVGGVGAVGEGLDRGQHGLGAVGGQEYPQFGHAVGAGGEHDAALGHRVGVAVLGGAGVGGEHGAAHAGA
jgi:drug/metabolite transporter (DMT)-like permease